MQNKLLLTLLMMCAALFSSAADRKFTLVIDAGHGGHDTGAPGKMSVEKNINLKVALAFGQYVEKNCSDVRVIYTRKTDVFVPLIERANIANKNKADLFISVHTNALDGGKISRGFETYTLGMHRAADNLNVAKRENSVILIEKNYKQSYAGFDPKSAESYIMFELMQDKHMANSVEMAKLIQSEVCALSGRVNKGVHQAGFLVLRETSMPSCLIELGFITTSDEEQFLNTTEGQDKMARGIYNAFVKYKKKYGHVKVSAQNEDEKEEQEKENLFLAMADHSSQDVTPNGLQGLAASTQASLPAISEEHMPMASPEFSEQRAVRKTIQPQAQVKKNEESPPAPKKEVMASAPKKETPTPKQETPAPPKEASAPKKETPAPKQVASAPKQVAPTPKKETSAPKQEAPTPKKETPAPKQETPTPKKETPAPKQEAPAPKPEKSTTDSVKSSPASPSIIFKVQIAAASQQLPTTDKVFQGVENIGFYQENGMVKYTVGESGDFEEIFQLRKQLQSKFPQAFIIAFRDGKKVDLAKAIKEYKNSKK